MGIEYLEFLKESVVKLVNDCADADLLDLLLKVLMEMGIGVKC